MPGAEVVHTEETDSSCSFHFVQNKSLEVHKDKSTIKDKGQGQTINDEGQGQTIKDGGQGQTIKV